MMDEEWRSILEFLTIGGSVLKIMKNSIKL